MLAKDLQYMCYFLMRRYWAMPGFYLKRMVMDNFNSKEVDPDIADSIDFMVENVSTNNHNGRSHVTNYIRQNNCYYYTFNIYSRS
jgi:hypothetical protein